MHKSSALQLLSYDQHSLFFVAVSGGRRISEHGRVSEHRLSEHRLPEFRAECGSRGLLRVSEGPDSVCNSDWTESKTTRAVQNLAWNNWLNMVEGCVSRYSLQSRAVCNVAQAKSFGFATCLRFTRYQLRQKIPRRFPFFQGKPLKHILLDHPNFSICSCKFILRYWLPTVYTRDGIWPTSLRSIRLDLLLDRFWW